MADSDAEFERDLRKDLPRGLKGREDSLPRTRWANADELGPDDWDYAKNPAGLFLGYRGGRMIGWKDDRHALTVAGMARDNQDETPYCLIQDCSRPRSRRFMSRVAMPQQRANVLSGMAA